MERKIGKIDAKTIDQLCCKIEENMGKSISKKKLTELSVSILWEQVNKQGCNLVFEGGFIDKSRLKQSGT